MDKILEFGSNVIGAASEKINTLNLSEKTRYISEKAGNMLGMSGSIYEINGRRYAEKGKIAEGGFGLVYLVRDDNNHPYALKRMFIQDRDRLASIKMEIDVMQRLRHHKNIVKLIDHKITENREKRETEILMLLEFCSGGSVLDIMNAREHSKLNEREILAIFADTCLAVMEMHNQQTPIAHRDLKIENVLYCEMSSCYKLCDFGSATSRSYNTAVEQDRVRAEDDINTFTTLFYRAPEMVDLYRGQVINEKVDIWALGCLLYKMAFYADPFEGGSLAIMNSRYQIPTDSRYSANLHGLIEFLLTPDPSVRPSIYDVLNRLEDIRTGSKRSGLQTFSPAKGAAEPRQNLVSSTNSTPSFSSPNSTSNRSSPANTPTTGRKQNLFDIGDEFDFFDPMAKVVPKPQAKVDEIQPNMTGAFDNFGSSWSSPQPQRTNVPMSNAGLNSSAPSVLRTSPDTGVLKPMSASPMVPQSASVPNSKVNSPAQSTGGMPIKANYNIDLKSYTSAPMAYSSGSNGAQRPLNNSANSSPSTGAPNAFNFDSFSMYSQKK
eukprot:gene13444-15846_t